MSELQFNVVQNPGVIKMNSAELETQLAEKMAEYKGKEFSEETKPEGKKDLANLRKLKKSVSDRDKDIKQQFMKPYDDFHTGVLRLIGLIDEPIGLIDGQIKEIEERRIKERREDIQKAYSDIVEEGLEDYIPLEVIYGSKWTNAGTTMKSIREEIEEIAKKTRDEIAVISSMNSDVTEKALNMYMSNRSLSGAIQYINNYEASKAEILRKQQEEQARKAEADRQAEIERIRFEERQRIREEERIRNEAKQEVVSEIAKVDEVEAAPLSSAESLKVIYTVVATPDEIKEIEMAFNSLGVYFERKDV
jgi:virulence-associated protein VapD